MGPSAASTAEDGPLCRPEPLIITTNVHDDLIPRLQYGTRLIGFKAIPFNSSTFQDDDLEEMLLLVFPTVPSESATTATPTITSEHKKKLQESLLKLKSEVTMVVSDEIKSMIVRKAQQLKMPIDGEEATVLLQTGLRFWTIGKVIHKTITSFELLIVYRFSLMASHGSLALSARSWINLG
ncbi:hypothetical protein ACA910_001879 [Epithemia clementina (nom. ined.)]